MMDTHHPDHERCIEAHRLLKQANEELEVLNNIIWDSTGSSGDFGRYAIADKAGDLKSLQNALLKGPNPAEIISKYRGINSACEQYYLTRAAFEFSVTGAACALGVRAEHLKRQRDWNRAHATEIEL